MSDVVWRAVEAVERADREAARKPPPARPRSKWERDADARRQARIDAARAAPPPPEPPSAPSPEFQRFEALTAALVQVPKEALPPGVVAVRVKPDVFEMLTGGR